MDQATALKELQSSKCRCGKPKKPGKSFCYFCYTQLPKDQRQALYRRLGDGYEEAYGKSIAYLFNRRPRKVFG